MQHRAGQRRPGSLQVPGLHSRELVQDGWDGTQEPPTSGSSLGNSAVDDRASTLWKTRLQGREAVSGGPHGERPL